MIVFNLCGGPGCGKTTMSYYLAYRLKKAGFRIGLVIEAARDLIDRMPNGVTPPQLLDNQLLVGGMQYEKLLTLKRQQYQAAICDSPLIQGIMYCNDLRIKEDLKTILYRLENDFDNFNIFVHRTPGCYDPESRVQRTEEDAKTFDLYATTLLKKIHYAVKWDEQDKCADAAVQLLKNKHVHTL